jgi:predicted protein tyrosine phosphatase
MEQATPSAKPWAVISICEKGNFPEIATNDEMVGRLNLKFHDVDYFKNGEREDDRILIDQDLAKQVLDFYLEMKEKGATVLYVHCLAGMCRSAAVAAALAKIQDDDDNVWFKTKRPNMRVYRCILEQAADRGLL